MFTNIEGLDLVLMKLCCPNEGVLNFRCLKVPKKAWQKSAMASWNKFSDVKDGFKVTHIKVSLLEAK